MQQIHTDLFKKIRVNPAQSVSSVSHPIMTTIRFENVVKTFPDMSRPAVDGVSLTVASGDFVVFLGPSGCGKTTLMKMVNRLYEPTSGEIYIDEQPIHATDATTLRRHIGYVIQQIGLFPHMTVAQNVAVVPRLLGWEDDRIAARVDELLDLVALPPDEYRERYPAQLSGGQRQRVGVARALAGDPGVILMDEPFGAIDAITRTELQDSLLELQRRLRKTILFVTHDVDEALRLADKIVILREGRIVQYDTPLRILTDSADDFVRQLVGAADIVRQLSLLKADQVMRPLNGESPAVSVHRDQSLREALSIFLTSHQNSLAVVDSEGQAIGLLNIDDIRGAIG